MKELTIEELKQMPGQPLQDKEEKEWRTIKFTTTQMHTWKAT